jgi:hypothetical protein
MFKWFSDLFAVEPKKPKEPKEPWVYDGKTQYRIITKRTGFADRYLQFFWDGEWRYVPNIDMMISGGEYLLPEKCPHRLPEIYSGDFMNCFFGCERTYDGFMYIPKEYPDILLYFSYGKKEHIAHEKELRRLCNVPDIEYL